VCVGYCRKAVELSPDPITRWCDVAALHGAGRNADALDKFEPPDFRVHEDEIVWMGGR
jgi:hypothetical protein